MTIEEQLQVLVDEGLADDLDDAARILFDTGEIDDAWTLSEAEYPRIPG